VPVASVAAVGLVIAGTAIAGAESSPSLPARTAAQLIADVQQAHGPGPLSGTIQETANLGLPALPGSGNDDSGLSLLSGAHTFNLWIADPAHVRVAEPVQLGESDFRRNGQQVWLWDSKNQTATHVILPPRRAGSGPFAGHRFGGHRSGGDPGDDATPPTPQQVARQILAAVGPTTTVSVQRNLTVAGQPAYQLVLAPKDSRSLVGQVKIAIDAHRYLPLRVAVMARGQSAPAFSLGFTALSFGRPAASNFTFTPPPGAKVKTINVPARPGATGSGHLMRPLPRGSLSQPGSSGGGWTSSYRPAGLSGYVPVYIPNEPIGPASALGSMFRVLRHGWLSVLVYPGQARSPGADTTTTGTATTGGSSGGRNTATSYVFTQAGTNAESFQDDVTINGTSSPPVPWNDERSWTGQWSIGHSWSTQPTQVSAQGPPGPGGPMPSPATLRQLGHILQALNQAATPVHGAWGSGRLLRTSLFSVLQTSHGTVLVGAVAPSVLYQDAATLK
jgi:hypothetical protein